MWCIQEIHLANIVSVFWDEHTASWRDVCVTGLWIFHNRDHHNTLSRVYPENVIRMHASQLAGSQLLMALHHYRSWEATDPRDKVYGLLNIITDKNQAEAVELDYNKSLSEVYADTVLAIIRLQGQLNTLSHVFHPVNFERTEDFTSWTPLWNDKTRGRIWLNFDGSFTSACKGHLALTSEAIELSYKRLCLTGIFYGKVVSVKCFIDDENMSSFAYSNRNHPYIRIAEELIGRTHPDDGNIEQRQRLARTLTAGWLNTREQHVQSSDEATQETFYTSFEIMLQILAGTGRDQIVISTDTSAKAEQYYTLAQHMGMYCRTFRLSNGAFGLGPQCMREGDIVVVLYGGDFPFVLRPAGNE